MENWKAKEIESNGEEASGLGGYFSIKVRNIPITCLDRRVPYVISIPICHMQTSCSLTF